MPLRAELRPSEIMGVVLDIDGTLLEPAETLVLKKYREHDHLLNFLNRLPPRESRFTFATGRAYAGIKDILAQVMKLRAFQPPQKLKHRSMPLILYNGSLIVSSDGRTLYKKWEIDRRSSINILEIALKHRLRPLIYCVNHKFLLGLEEKVFSVSRSDDDELEMSDLNGLAIKNIAQSMLSEIESAVAILLYGASSASPSDVRDMLADIRDFARANVFGDRVEITPKDANKGVALVKLADILDWDIDRIMVVGDSTNDIAMMKVAGIGVALANSPPEVRKMSDYVTELSYARGVNEAILKGVIRGDWKVKPKCRT